MITMNVSENNSNEENLQEIMKGLEEIRQMISNITRDLSENNQPDEALEILEDTEAQLGLLTDSLDTVVRLIK